MTDRIINLQQATISRYERTLRQEREFLKTLLDFLKKGQFLRATAALQRYLKEVGEDG